MGESIMQETFGMEVEDEQDHGNDVLSRLPEEIRDGLAPEQVSAIRKSIREDWGGHPVNIRLNIPLLFKRGYVTMVAGVCKRDPERHKQDREVHPLRTIGNILFVGGCAALIYLVVIAAILFYSSAIDF